MEGTDSTNFQQLAEEMQTSLDALRFQLHKRESADGDPTSFSYTLTETKRHFIKTCGKMQIMLEDPLWSLMNLGTSFTVTAAMSVMLDLDIANKIPERGTIVLADLALDLKVDLDFLARVLRILTGIHILEETGPGEFRHTRPSLLVRDRSIRDLLLNNVTLSFRASAFAPEAWKENHYRNLSLPGVIPFKRAFNSSYYDYLFKLNPQLGSEFFGAMEALTEVAVKDIALRYPFERVLTFKKRSKKPAVMVDVGGGRGQVVHRIHKQIEKDITHFIVQDLNSDQQFDGLEYQKHDFFLPQPVLGAQVYFLRHILHNHGDSDCILILNNIAQAMVRGESTLVLCERIIPPLDAPLALTQFDLLMAILFGGMERSTEQFKNLLSKVNPPLALKNIITDDPIRESFLEVELF